MSNRTASTASYLSDEAIGDLILLTACLDEPAFASMDAYEVIDALAWQGPLALHTLVNAIEDKTARIYTAHTPAFLAAGLQACDRCGAVHAPEDTTHSFTEFYDGVFLCPHCELFLYQHNML